MLTQCLLNFNIASMASARDAVDDAARESTRVYERDSVGATQVADAFLLGGV